MAGRLPAANSLGVTTTPGVLVLLAEYDSGLGSDTLVLYAEGRISQGDQYESHMYVTGMGDMLFLEMMRKEDDIVLVLALPDLYVRQIDIQSTHRSQDALDGILQNSPRCKMEIMLDVVRTILRHDPNGERGAYCG